MTTAGRAYYLANRERISAQHREYRSRPGNRERQQAYMAKWRLEQPRIRRDHLGARYGVSQADFAGLLANQNGVCAICPATSDSRGYRLNVDHVHGTTRVRGLLCNRCNTGLGLFRDTPQLLARAIGYLLRFVDMDGVSRVAKA